MRRSGKQDGYQTRFLTKRLAHAFGMADPYEEATSAGSEGSVVPSHYDNRDARQKTFGGLATPSSPRIGLTDFSIKSADKALELLSQRLQARDFAGAEGLVADLLSTSDGRMLTAAGDLLLSYLNTLARAENIESVLVRFYHHLGSRFPESHPLHAAFLALLETHLMSQEASQLKPKALDALTRALEIFHQPLEHHNTYERVMTLLHQASRDYTGSNAIRTQGRDDRHARAWVWPEADASGNRIRSGAKADAVPRLPTVWAKAFDAPPIPSDLEATGGLGDGAYRTLPDGTVGHEGNHHRGSEESEQVLAAAHVLAAGQHLSSWDTPNAASALEQEALPALVEVPEPVPTGLLVETKREPPSNSDRRGKIRQPRATPSEDSRDLTRSSSVEAAFAVLPVTLPVALPLILPTRAKSLRIGITRRVRQMAVVTGIFAIVLLVMLEGWQHLKPIPTLPPSRAEASLASPPSSTTEHAVPPTLPANLLPEILEGEPVNLSLDISPPDHLELYLGGTLYPEGLVNDVTLRPGRYALEIYRQSHEPYRQELRLDPGTKQNLRITLRRSPTLRVEVIPADDIQILLNEKIVAVNGPLVDYIAAPGEHVLEIQKPGYHVYRETIKLDVGSRISRKVTLTPAKN